MHKKMIHAGAIALFAAAITGASPASAAPDPGPKPHSTTHCVAQGISIAGDGKISRPAQPDACFATLAEAVRYGTHGAVVLPANANRVTQSQLDSAEKAAAFSKTAATTTSYMLGLEYKDKNMGGSTLSLFGQGRCGDGVVSNFPSLAGIGWNNTIGSAVSYSGCLSGHYQYDNFGGPSIVCNCYSNLGALNDLTSSIRFSRTGR